MQSDARTPFVENEGSHPWRRMVSLGDSFTEGIGDPEPDSPGGHRGWADRVADVLASQADDFAYANLAVRGKLIRQISDDQIDAALALKPDLVTLCAGGNDVIRPGTDPDAIGEIFRDAVARLSSSGAAVVVFTGFDVGWNPVFRSFRGKVAIYNENMRAIAEQHDAIVADCRSRLRAARDQLAAQVRSWLPEWKLIVPAGGMALWAELPEARSGVLSIAARNHGLRLVAGPNFAPAGGLDRWVRLPYTVTESELEEVGPRLAAAWEEAKSMNGRGPTDRARIVA